MGPRLDLKGLEGVINRITPMLKKKVEALPKDAKKKMSKDLEVVLRLLRLYYKHRDFFTA